MQYIYFDGALVRADSKTLRISNHAFNYGTATFEGMRAVWDEATANWYFFRPDRHLARLLRGAKFLGLEFALSLEDFITILSKLLRKNGRKSDIYLRPFVFDTIEGVGLMKSGTPALAIYAEPNQLRTFPARTACVVPQRRPSDGSFAAKITGNYVLSFAAQQAARQNKCEVGILLSDKGHVSEASAMNLFWVKDGRLFTPSLACGPLAGVTRESLIQLSHDQLGMKVREGKYRATVLAQANEIFICGTGSGVTPIKRFENQRMAGERKTSLTQQLWRLYESTIRSRPDRYSHWFVPCR